MTMRPLTSLLAACVGLLFATRCQCQTFPSQETVRRWASDLNAKLGSLTTGEGDVTAATKYQRQYQQSLTKQFHIRRPNGKEVVEKMARDMATLFRKNTEALERLQVAAEDAVRNYTYKEELDLSRVDYINMNDLGNVSAKMEESKHFRQEVYAKQSGVHIPIEIYEGYNSNQMSKICPSCTSVCDLCQNGLFWRQESRLGLKNVDIIGDPDILNGLSWSQALDKVFKENKRQYPDIFWQSFGSQEGYLRVFPAARWRTSENAPDLFDVRRRPWYIHGSVSPKDMIILLDTSGSMHGQSFDIMKIAAKTLINTLGEDDFVNVAQFSRNVTWVTPCLDTLVQANSRNKRLLFDGIDKLVDLQIADYGDALTFAFDQFERFERERRSEDGADCHKLVMVFSDGGTKYPADVIKRYRNDSDAFASQVRIFTYAIGPHPIPTVALKHMACNADGAFTTITAMGSIRTKIQDFARVLSKPTVLSQTRERLKGVTHSRDHLGLGLVITLTLPVFNMSEKSDNQTLAGVVGIDIPTFILEDMAPRHMLGPLGYAFAINSNGFLVFHPAMWMDANFLEEPSHIDINDIEGEGFTEDSSQGENKIDTLRKAMIDGTTGAKLINFDKVYDLQSRLPLKDGKEYHYISVAGSSLSIAVAVDKRWSYLDVPEQQLDGIGHLSEEDTLLAPWNFCGDRDSERVTLAAIQDEIAAGSCFGTGANHLAWDVANAKTVFDANADTILSNKLVLSHFVMTDGGLTLVRPQSGLQDLAHTANPYNSSLFRSAVSHRRPQITVQRYVVNQLVPVVKKKKSKHTTLAPPVVSDSASNGTQVKRNFVFRARPAAVFVSSPVIVTEAGNSADYVAAVGGARLDPDELRDILLDATAKRGSAMPAGAPELNCSSVSDLLCFMIDHTAHVVTSNQDRKNSPSSSLSVDVGDFLGAVDPQLFKHFVQKHQLFKERVDFNYQALCPDEIDCSPGARSVIAFTLKNLFHLMYRLASAVQQMGYVIISVVSLVVFPSSGSALSEYGFELPQGVHRCTTKVSTWHLSEEAKTEYHGRVSSRCNDVECNRDFHVYLLPSLNAVLVVADPRCDTCHVPADLTDEPVEVAEYRENCKLPNRYRKRPEECFAFHEEEKSECSSGTTLHPISWMGLMILFKTVILRSL